MILFPVIVHMHLDGSMMIVEKDLEQFVLLLLCERSNLL